MTGKRFEQRKLPVSPAPAAPGSYSIFRVGRNVRMTGKAGDRIEAFIPRHYFKEESARPARFFGDGTILIRLFLSTTGAVRAFAGWAGRAERV